MHGVTIAPQPTGSDSRATPWSCPERLTQTQMEKERSFRDSRLCTEARAVLTSQTWLTVPTGPRRGGQPPEGCASSPTEPQTLPTQPTSRARLPDGPGPTPIRPTGTRSGGRVTSILPAPPPRAVLTPSGPGPGPSSSPLRRCLISAAQATGQQGSGLGPEGPRDRTQRQCPEAARDLPGARRGSKANSWPKRLSQE